MTAFSRKQNTPKSLLIFSKVEQTIVSYGRCLHKRKEILEKISLMFSSCNHSHPGDPHRSQPHLIIVSENWLGSFKRNWTSIFGSPVIKNF